MTATKQSDTTLDGIASSVLMKGASPPWDPDIAHKYTRTSVYSSLGCSLCEKHS